MSEIEGFIDRETIGVVEQAIVFDYNATNNSLIFNNPVQNNSGFVGDNITFSSSLIVNGVMRVNPGDSLASFSQVTLPTDEGFNLNIPTIDSGGTIQGPNMVVANNNLVDFYACSGQTFLYNSVHLNGNLNLTSLSQISTLQEALDLKLNISDAYTATTVNSLLGTKLDITASATTTNSIVSLVNLKAAITDVSATFNTKLNISDAYTATTVNSLLSVKAPINNPTFTGTVGGVTKSMVGLGNCDNTTDAAKPVSTATQTALNGKQDAVWVAGRLIAAGNTDKDAGKQGFTVSNNCSGGYVFTIPAHPSGAAYIVIATPSPQNPGAAYCSTYVSSSTTFTVNTFNGSGTATNQAFSFHTIP